MTDGKRLTFDAELAWAEEQAYYKKIEDARADEMREAEAKHWHEMATAEIENLQRCLQAAEAQRDEAVALLRRLYDASFGDPEYELGDTAIFLARIEEARE